MNVANFDFHIDLLKAILWQYNDASKYQEIILKEQEWVNNNYQGFWEDWYRNVFDIRTANDFGLTIWSIILEVPLIVVNEIDEEDIPIGFNDSTDGTLDNSNFRPTLGGVQTLTVEQARTVILMRYHQLTSNGTVLDTNKFYKEFFEGQIYVVDNLDMTVTYVISFSPPARIRYILENYDILPRPAGVRIREVNVVPEIPFGFDEFFNNFDNGTFET